MTDEEHKKIVEMKEFANGYKEIYQFCKDKVESDLTVYKQYYYANPFKFDPSDVNLGDKALRYKENREKFSDEKFTLGESHE